jgi:hypothetical protein
MQQLFALWAITLVYGFNRQKVQGCPENHQNRPPAIEKAQAKEGYS